MGVPLSQCQPLFFASHAPRNGSTGCPRAVSAVLPAAAYQSCSHACVCKASRRKSWWGGMDLPAGGKLTRKVAAVMLAVKCIQKCRCL